MQKYTFQKAFEWILVMMSVFLLLPSPAFSEFRIGEDIEKPKPAFTREGDVVAAKLIPRAKNTSVIIRFKVEGGKLDSVDGIDFYDCDRPEVNIKNFKSALFAVNASNIPKGEEIKVSIISDFFISSTQYYIFNEAAEKQWMIPDIQNIGFPDRVQELIVNVRDGGPYDSDGKEDGNIRFIGGPRDSFWGYALGTLFIRFFGIFLVLSVLMIGMILSGKFFNWYLSRKTGTGGGFGKKETVKIASLPKSAEPENLMEPVIDEQTVSGPTAAAIALALHLHQASTRSRYATETGTNDAASSWTQSGRATMMNDRLKIFNR